MNSEADIDSSRLFWLDCNERRSKFVTAANVRCEVHVAEMREKRSKSRTPAAFNSRNLYCVSSYTLVLVNDQPVDPYGDGICFLSHQFTLQLVSLQKSRALEAKEAHLICICVLLVWMIIFKWNNLYIIFNILSNKNCEAI